MRIYVGEDYKGMSRKAANIISAQIILKPDSVMDLLQAPLQLEFMISL